MGCDIHAFVEYKRRADSENWRSFGKEFRLDRNYLMFGLLAGVRVDVTPVAEARGIPSDIGYSVREEYTRYVVKDEDYHDEPNHIDRTRAEKWVADGSSTWFDKDHHWITDPDGHTHSWVTTKEYEKCLSKYASEDTGGWSTADYKAILAVLQLFESEGFEARLVFWFDN